MKNHEAEELHSELVGEVKDHSNTLIMWQKDIERNQTLRAEIAKLELQLAQLKEANAELGKDGVHVFLDDRVTPILMSAIRLYTSKLDLNSPHGRYENAFCIDLLAHLNAAIKDQSINASITKGTQ